MRLIGLKKKINPLKLYKIIWLNNLENLCVG